MTHADLESLVNKVITGRDYDKPPGTPFRPFRTQPTTTRRWTQDIFDFVYREDYVGSWSLGWSHPWVKKNPETKRVMQREGWLPNMAWNLRRPIMDSRYTECHHEWHVDVVRHGDQMIRELNDALDPEFALLNSKVKYVITKHLVSAFEAHLDEYFIRPETQRRIAILRSL